MIIIGTETVTAIMIMMTAIDSLRKLAFSKQPLLVVMVNWLLLSTSLDSSASTVTARGRCFGREHSTKVSFVPLY